MPTLTRWHIKSGLLFFVFALLLALGFRLQPLLHLPEQIHYLRPVYYHALMVGWITQIIIGVSIWMFPRHTRQDPRGNEFLGWVTFGFLNIGLLLRVIAEPFINTHPSRLLAYMIFFSGLLQWLAAILYTGNIWKRIKLK